MQLVGSVAVVTGASAGIGWATAVTLARRGATVVAAARREERLRLLVDQLLRRGVRAQAVVCDVREWGDLQSLAAEVRRVHGRCDVLVNNAGIPGGGSFSRLPVEELENVIRTNYLSVIYGTKAFLPMMLEAGRGHVVNVASLAGRFAVPGSAVYSSTKHAVVALSEALYHELRPNGITVTAVNPGLVATERFAYGDLRRRAPWLVMRPQRVAEAIAEVVRMERGPEVSIPRWFAALEAFRVLTPSLYRFGVAHAVRLNRGSSRSHERRPEREERTGQR